MKNYVQAGDVLDFIAPTGGVVSGGGYVHGQAFAVASATAAEGETYAGVVEGVVNLPKATGAIGEGALVYWDAAAKNATTTATSNKKIGYATAAQVSADATVNVKLVPSV
jgi:predicted RecA/RadA family phage recombinase